MPVDLSEVPPGTAPRAAGHVAPGARKQGQARRDELRDVVLAAVERHLRSGTTYSELSVVEVATEAGISRSTFYAYFVDKTTLLRTWYAEFTGQLQAAAREWWSLDGSATRADLRRALRRIMAAYRAHPELLVAAHEAVAFDEGVRDVVHEAMRAYIEQTRVHIEAGQRDGFVDHTLPPAETAYWLQWMAERALHMMGRRSDGELERMLDAHTRIVWNTLYAPARRDASRRVA